MAQQIGEDTKVTLDLKTLGMVAAGIGTIVGGAVRNCTDGMVHTGKYRSD